MKLKLFLLGPKCDNSPRINVSISSVEGRDGFQLVLNGPDGQHTQNLSRESTRSLATALRMAASRLGCLDEFKPDPDEDF